MAPAGGKRLQTQKNTPQPKKHKIDSAPNEPLQQPAPTESLYIKNLNDQVAIDDLRLSLYMLFSSFGHVVAVNAHKSPKMRGQAHIAFGNTESAIKALDALQGQKFLSKKLVIAYAKHKSDRLAWLQRDLDT